jgi:hypothetical protein
MKVPLSQVSRIFFTTPTADVVARVPDSRDGVLLAGGDFVEGQILDVNESRVKLSSVLFGIKRFETRQVAVVAYRNGIAATTQRYHLRAADGSSLLFEDAEFAANLLHIKDPILSALVFPFGEVTELNAGPGRVALLASLPAEVRPKREPGHAHVIDGGVAVKAGMRLAYELNGGYRGLSLFFAVPPSVPPAESAVLSVTADGKSVYQSEPRTSVQPPLPVSVDLTGVKSMVISLESTSEHENVHALLVDAALVRTAADR